MKKSRLEEIRDIRLQKVRDLREMGIDPYPAKSDRNTSSHEVAERYSELEGKEVIVAGRLMSLREHGNIAFGHIQDKSGQVQLFFQKKDLEETNIEKQILGFKDVFKYVDVGDFIQAKGIVGKTVRGEVSIIPHEFRILTKSLRPLPEKREGLKDTEEIFRRRYLDLTMNEERRALFTRKSEFWRVQREFMHKEGFIEVETPVLEHVTGGADAKPFVTHHNALNTDFFLRISTELYEKRLIGGGFEKIYTLGPNFRNEGIDDEHLQEYYQIEWYWAYANYRDTMDMVKRMFRDVAQKVYGTTKFKKGDHEFDLANEWTEIDYTDIIKKELGINIFEDSEERMLEVLNKHKIDLSEGVVNKGRLVDNLWKIIRKNITGPAFLVNEPKFVSPLAKSKPDNDEITERFHIIIAGSELGNGYSELNDPTDQLARFREQQAARDAGDDEAQMMDIDYVEMLEYGMPPTSGYAHSERLFWFLEDVTAREGTLFPQTRQKISPLTKKIYGLEDKSKKKKSKSNGSK